MDMAHIFTWLDSNTVKVTTETGAWRDTVWNAKSAWCEGGKVHVIQHNGRHVII